MDRELAINEKVQTPKISCAIVVRLDERINVSLVIHDLQKIGIHNVVTRKPRYDSSVCLSVVLVHNEEFWEINTALDKMFSKINSCLPQFKRIVKKYGGTVYIDVAFYQYGTYPALVFSGKNMEKIHYLEANISIDPYDYTASV